MFDIGWSEMIVIFVVALVVIGPKDLPKVARTLGQWVRKARSLAREFQTSLEDMAREAELDDIKKEIERVGHTDLGRSIEKTVDPKGDLAKAFDMSDAEPRAAIGAPPPANGQLAKPKEVDPVGAEAAASAPDRTAPEPPSSNKTSASVKSG